MRAEDPIAFMCEENYIMLTLQNLKFTSHTGLIAEYFTKDDDIKIWIKKPRAI